MGSWVQASATNRAGRFSFHIMQKTLLKFPCSWTTCYLLVSTCLLATAWAELIQENQASDLDSPPSADIDYRDIYELAARLGSNGGQSKRTPSSNMFMRLDKRAPSSQMLMRLDKRQSHDYQPIFFKRGYDNMLMRLDKRGEDWPLNRQSRMSNMLMRLDKRRAGAPEAIGEDI